MNIRQQVLAFGAAAALLVGIAGAIGAVSASRMSESIRLATQASQAMSAGQAADMMHDAIRGDAQRALPAALRTRNRDRVADRMAGTDNVIQATVAKADDDLAGAIFWRERKDFARSTRPQE